MAPQARNTPTRRQVLTDKERRRRLRNEMLGFPVADEPVAVNMDMAQVMSGVTLSWLQYVFKRDRNTAKILLTDCPVLRHGAGGAPIYDVATAAQYLVKPKLDVAKILSTMKESDLPDDLKPKIWDARLKQQRWLQRAGDLWHTADVVAVFGDVLKDMKGRVMLWSEDVADETVLSAAQRDVIETKTDELLASMHEALTAIAGRKSTQSQAADLDKDRDEDE